MKKTRTYSIKPELYKLPAVGSWAHLGTEYKARIQVNRKFTQQNLGIPARLRFKSSGHFYCRKCMSTRL